jgi:hypothetical protein
MKTDKISRWLTLGANFGVVLGLLLVALQIRQEAELTKIQLFSDHTNARKEWAQAMMGGSPMNVVAKSIERPKDLSLEELLIMDNYLISALNELRRLELLRKSGLDTGTDIEGLHYFYFGSNFAQAWYQAYGGENELEAVDAKVSGVDKKWIVNFFNRVLSKVDDDSGQKLARDHAAND